MLKPRQMMLRFVGVLCALLVLMWALQDAITVSTTGHGKALSAHESESPSAVSDSTISSDSDSSAVSDRRALRIPVAEVDSSALHDTYNAPRSGGRSHRAIDILAPQGTPVVAAVSGTIVRMHYSDGGGRSLYQFGPNSSWVYYYAHLDDYAEELEEGDTVSAGQVIGYVGDTGNAPDGVYHLHFAIWAAGESKNIWRGRPVNPFPLLKEGRRPGSAAE